MSPAKSTRLSHDERHDQLVRMGIELLGARPYEQISIGEIARAAGISKGLLYHYFPTKSHFVAAVLIQSRDELQARMAAGSAGDPVERLDASLDAFLDYVEDRATGFLAIARARGGDDELIREVLIEGRRRRVAGLVEFAAALAGVPRSELECPLLEAAMEGWIASCEGVVVRWLGGGDDLRRAEVHHLLRHALLAALASVAATGSTPGCTRLAGAAADALAKTQLRSAA